jgi:hypothetical protein
MNKRFSALGGAIVLAAALGAVGVPAAASAAVCPFPRGCHGIESTGYGPTLDAAAQAADEGILKNGCTPVGNLSYEYLGNGTWEDTAAGVCP